MIRTTTIFVLIILFASCAMVMLWNHPSMRGERSENVCKNGGTWNPRHKVCNCNFTWIGSDCSVWRYQRCYFGHGHDYRGQLSRTMSGQSCLPWTTDWNNQLYPLGEKGIGIHNHCRNPDEHDKNGIWCYVGGEKLIDRCNATICPDSYKALPNVTANEGDDDRNTTVNVLFGPLISGICGGVVALLLFIAMEEYLRRKGYFRRKKNKKDQKKFHQKYFGDAGIHKGKSLPDESMRPLGGVVTVNLDTWEQRRQSGSFKPDTLRSGITVDESVDDRDNNSLLDEKIDLSFEPEKQDQVRLKEDKKEDEAVSKPVPKPRMYDCKLENVKEDNKDHITERVGSNFNEAPLFNSSSNSHFTSHNEPVVLPRRKTPTASSNPGGVESHEERARKERRNPRKERLGKDPRNQNLGKQNAATGYIESVEKRKKSHRKHSRKMNEVIEYV